jgi:hypothetical protein
LETTVSNRDQDFEEAGEIIVAELNVYEPEIGDLVAANQSVVKLSVLLFDRLHETPRPPFSPLIVTKTIYLLCQARQANNNQPTEQRAIREVNLREFAAPLSYCDPNPQPYLESQNICSQ